MKTKEAIVKLCTCLLTSYRKLLEISKNRVLWVLAQKERVLRASFLSEKTTFLIAATHAVHQTIRQRGQLRLKRPATLGKQERKAGNRPISPQDVKYLG